MCATIKITLENDYDLIILAGTRCAGSFTGQHWLDQVFWVPDLKSKIWLFMSSGMVYTVRVEALLIDTGSPEDLCIDQASLTQITCGQLVTCLLHLPASCCCCQAHFDVVTALR